MAVFNNIQQIAEYYGLSPKKMTAYNIVPSERDVTIWQKGKASVHFLKDDVATSPECKNVARMSYDGSPKAAYQIALNVLHSPELQSKMQITL